MSAIQATAQSTTLAVSVLGINFLASFVGRAIMLPQCTSALLVSYKSWLPASPYVLCRSSSNLDTRFASVFWTRSTRFSVSFELVCLLIL